MWLPPKPPGESYRCVYVDLLSNPNRGLNLSNPQTHMQLSSTWGCAHLLAINLWQEDRSSPDTMTAAMLEFIEEVALAEDAEELMTAPLLVAGISRTGRFVIDAIKEDELPAERVLGYAAVVRNLPENSVHDKMLPIPGIFVPGENNGGAEICQEVQQARMQGAQISCAMHWGVDHKCGPCERAYAGFFNQVLLHRLGPNQQVLEVNEENGWLGSHESWQAEPWGQYAGDAASASQLIDESYAYLWEAFTLRNPVATFASPHVVAQEEVVMSDTRCVDITAIEAAVTSPPPSSLRLFDGATELATGQSSNDGMVVFNGLVFTPGVHMLTIHDDSGRAVAKPSVFMCLQ